VPMLLQRKVSFSTSMDNTLAWEQQRTGKEAFRSPDAPIPVHKNTSPCAIRFVIVCTQSRTACCEAKTSCPTANSDKESERLKEKGGETATYIKKKKGVIQRL